MNQFSSLEDRLLKKYWDKNPGMLFKEVKVGEVENRKRARRIDAILIPNKEKQVHFRGDFNLEKLRKEIEGEPIEVIEVKYKLNRNVIGQVEVATYLVDNDFNPKKISSVIVCGKPHSDLEDYCSYKDINVSIFKGLKGVSNQGVTSTTIQKTLTENGLLIFTPLDLHRFLDMTEETAQKAAERYAKRGHFVRLRRGYYALADNVPHSYYVANYIYQPSYVSLESALSYHQLIPESIYAVTSVTPRATQSFEALNKEFTYTKIKKQAFKGYHKEQINDCRVLIAEPEKALADYFYLCSLGKKRVPDRLDVKNVDQEKLFDYVELFERKKLKDFVKSHL